MYGQTGLRLGRMTASACEAILGPVMAMDKYRHVTLSIDDVRHFPVGPRFLPFLILDKFLSLRVPHVSLELIS